MKWIGQHIYDLVSRFRSDVYLEDISSGTIASGGNLGLDSNNKIVKQADTGITDLHGAGVDGSANQLLTDDGDGTVTSESTLTYDGSTEILSIGANDDGGAMLLRQAHTDEAGGDLIVAAGFGGGTNKAGGDLMLYGGRNTGNATGGSIKFHGFPAGSSGSGVLGVVEVGAIDSVGNLQVDGTITTGSTAAMTNAGLLSVANQSNITGLGTIGTGTWQGTSIATTYTAAKVTSIVAGDGIDVSGATGDVTVTAETATDSNPGVVELATTAEADTGTDTARAVTPAGLKSHVDARFSYQYIPLSMNITGSGAGNWEYVSGNGIANHLYNQDGGAGGTTASNTDGSASTITISKNQMSGGIIVPYDSVLVGFYAQTRSNNNSARGLGIFTGVPVWNDYEDATVFLRGAVQNDTSAVGGDDHYSIRPFEHSVLDINLALDAGDCIWMAGRDPAGAGGGMIASVTIVLKTLIP